MKSSSLLCATDHLEELITRLMPVCMPLRLHEVALTTELVTVVLASGQAAACCPLCGELSARVHSHLVNKAKSSQVLR